MVRARRRGGRARRVGVVLVALTAAGGLPANAGATRDPANPRDFFGIAGRDPWYEYNTNPEQFPNDVNRTFLENMTSDMAEMGAGWVRIEFHGEYDEPTGPGRIDYSKYDWFIRELAPKYGIKVLAVMGSGVLADLDKTYEFRHINDTPGPDGTNLYSRAFVQRVAEVADHYGDAIAAYEILNEPNANQLLDWETSGRVQAVDPEIYGRIVTDSYAAIKPAHPNVQIVMGSLLHRAETGRDEHFDWLREVYRSRAITQYVAGQKHYPFDAVSIHPYYLSAQGVLDHMVALRDLQASFNDTSGIWITEVGLPAVPPEWSSDGIMDPTTSEQEQADFLRDVYTLLRDRAPWVDRVFWFKFEDFGYAGTYANWGLVRLRDAAFRYGPDATPWPRKEAFRVYQSLARPDAAPTAGSGSARALLPRDRSHAP